MRQDMALVKADGTLRLIRLILYTEVNYLEAYFVLWTHLHNDFEDKYKIKKME